MTTEEMYEAVRNWDALMGKSYEKCMKDVRQEDAYPIGNVHDWRNHVPDPLWNAWDTFDETARFCMYVMAQEQAHAEEWD